METENVVLLNVISFMVVTSAGMKKSCLFGKRKLRQLNNSNNSFDNLSCGQWRLIEWSISFYLCRLRYVPDSQVMVYKGKRVFVEHSKMYFKFRVFT